MTPELTGDDRATIAENAIFRGELDHWGSVTTDDGPRWECGACGQTERVRVVCAGNGWRAGADLTVKADGIAGRFAYRLHLSGEHLDEVINTLEGRT
jgi:hypothetical protein